MLHSSKKSEAYYKLFNKLRDAIAADGRILNPKPMVSDFESDLMDATQKYYIDYFILHQRFGVMCKILVSCVILGKKQKSSSS